ncbi:AMP-dependent synthetase/ligase [Ramlibacter albus]|uniref:AMP-binding protein n=1 Tax=Ramlibacter albus TaxID=2079448 RepID=A0A923S042_9BURK|nr:AMP-binding protein [Ramlibacter albus]MBC5762860.1 AMP-binding protein [Ramlibacter albus]
MSSDESIQDAALNAGEHTLPRLLQHWARTTPDALALREKDLGIWNRVTWREYHDTARRFALGLLRLGFRPGERLAIASEDTPQWMFADLGTQAIGGVVVGIYPTNPWPELQYIVHHSNSRFVVCGDQEQVDKVFDAMSKHDAGLPDVVKIIAVDMKGMRGYPRDKLLSFDEVLELGDQYAAGSPQQARAFDDGIAATRPDDTCMLVYTSGTTGPPKGAMLSHRNLLVTTDKLRRCFDLDRHNMEVLCYLPLCHVAERAFSCVMHMMTGGVVNYAESIDTVAVNLREIAPKVFLGVPRIWEKLQQGILMRMQDATRLQRWAFRRCFESGRALFERVESRGGPFTMPERLHFFVLWLLMFRNLQKFIGLDRLRCGFCGGASVSPEVLKFFRILGLPVYQVYGMTESGGVIFHQHPQAARLGATGTPIEGLNWKIAEDGELVVKHPAVFKGYIHDSNATALTVQDGWLHTGDIVALAPNNELTIVDRKKAIIITSGGKNISPSEIENALKDSLYIREAIVLGDGRHYLAALIQIDYDTVGKWAQEKRLAFTTYRNLSQLPEVRELVDAEVRRVNKLFARVENIRKFLVLEKELDHDDGELTATQKVRRNIIGKKFAREIEMIYGGGTA